MKEQLHALFSQAIDKLRVDGVIPTDLSVNLVFERTRQKEHGDFACNVAMMLAKPAKKNPRELASLVVAALPEDPLIAKFEIAGPGFINLFLASDAQTSALNAIFTLADRYGFAEPNSKQKIMVEFVSANPTGPLHVGHGRGAAYGDALARVLAAAGHEVEREYYVNDAGRQMDILAVSVWIRYLQANQIDVSLPDNCYKGQYVIDMGESLARDHGNQYTVQADTFNQARTSLEAEDALDASIALAKETLGEEGFRVFFDVALTSILADIQQDLGEFGVNYDTWFSERSLFDSGKIDRAIQKLQESGDIYEKEGALWFRSTDYGDEKDRCVVRDNGQPTYFASDIAYHQDKLDRGFDLAINVWGSDHHGYIPRVKAALEALGLDQNKLKVLLVQFAVLYRGGEKVGMSTRSGEFVTLRELRDDIGSDAARFFYAQRKSEQHMDFDLDLAKAQNNENPMYYVQYAHARICRLFENAAQQSIDCDDLASADFALLNHDQEGVLITSLQRFPEIVEKAAKNFEPHQITYYLKDVATAYHSYYNSHKVLDAPAAKRNAMLALSRATQQVIRNGLKTIGVGAPESM